jgi:pimeloyl-ACP methyl ester carboxylesterase
MTDQSLPRNPHALPDALTPTISYWQVNGTTLYAEVRGTGPAILLIPGGAEDAEGWRPVAERLSSHTVITYDRRGTLRSGREGWPGGGSAQHADDAAGLMRSQSLDRVTVFGASSAGIIAVQMALRHPDLVRLALVYEPGYFRVVPGGVALQGPANAAVRTYLKEHPGDWPGAYAAFGDAVAAAIPTPAGGLLDTPVGMEWYARREEVNAEPLVRDDIPILTTEAIDAAALAASDVEIRFAFGTRSADIFREIVEHLAAVRGTNPDAIEGVGHALYFHPDAAAGYIGSWAARS